VRQQKFLDLAEDDPFSGEVTEIIVSDFPTISHEFRIYTTRKSHPCLLAVSLGAPLNVSIDGESVPAFAVSINDGTSLILEFDLLKCIAAERKRMTSSNIYGDTKLVQEIVSMDETAYPRFKCTGKHFAMRTSRRELAYNECFVGSDISGNPINEIACLQYLKNNCRREEAHEHVLEIREAFATHHYVFSVSKYLGDSTVKELKQATPDISEEVVKTIAREILFGLSLLHKNGIQHGAVSPSNVFVRLRKNGKPNFVLSEPGHAKYLSMTDGEFVSTVFDRPTECSASFLSEDIWSMVNKCQYFRFHFPFHAYLLILFIFL
jgi:serine/threonine protein kinase